MDLNEYQRAALRTAAMDYFGISLDDVARVNIAKLADRQDRAMLGGSGDNR